MQIGIIGAGAADLTAVKIHLSTPIRTIARRKQGFLLEIADGCYHPFDLRLRSTA